MANTEAESALPFLQIFSQCDDGMRLPRMMPFTSPTPITTVCVPSGNAYSFLDIGILPHSQHLLSSCILYTGQKYSLRQVIECR